jgi:hypothetical protein
LKNESLFLLDNQVLLWEIPVKEPWLAEFQCLLWMDASARSGRAGYRNILLEGSGLRCCAFQVIAR